MVMPSGELDPFKNISPPQNVPDRNPSSVQSVEGAPVSRFSMAEICAHQRINAEICSHMAEMCANFFHNGREICFKSTNLHF